MTMVLFTEPQGRLMTRLLNSVFGAVLDVSLAKKTGHATWLVAREAKLPWAEGPEHYEDTFRSLHDMGLLHRNPEDPGVVFVYDGEYVDGGPGTEVHRLN